MSVNYEQMIADFEKYDWPEAVTALRAASTIIEQMTALVRWQTAWRATGYQPMQRMHPLTCGNNSNHSPLYPLIEGDAVVLVCADCDYRQDNWPIGMVTEAMKPDAIPVTMAAPPPDILP